MPLDADRLFHLRIAEATGNSALVLVVKTLWDQRIGPLYLRLEHHYDTPALWTSRSPSIAPWSRRFPRTTQGGARAAMQRHLNHADKRFSTGWDAIQ